MARIVVTGRKNTVYGRARQTVEVEHTPRIDELIRLGVLYRPHSEVKSKKTTTSKKAASAPAPVVGVTSAPAGDDALVSDPIDHEGART